MELKPILGLLIASAIPVVMFALWSEYFRNDLESSGKPKGDAEEEEVYGDRITRVRVAGLMSTLLQLVVFLSTSPVRQESATNSVSGLGLALMALVIQRSIQLRLEQQILPISSESPARTTPSVFPTSLFWAFAGMCVYFGILAGCVFASAVAVAVFRLEGWAGLAVIGLGALSGYTLALASNFLLSSFFFRRLVPSEPITSPQALALLEKWFAESGVTTPELRSVQSEAVKSANAWVTGFPQLKGIFRPVLWMTPTLLQDFSKTELHGELEAIVKHEAAHMKLRHLSQRFFLAWLMSLLVLATMAGSLALNTWFKSQQVTTALPLFSMVAAMILLFQSFRGLQRQGKGHELEADRYCVEKLGASATSLISALKRIESWNMKVSGQQRFTESPATLGSHPAIEERIAALQPMADAEVAASPEEKIAA